MSRSSLTGSALLPEQWTQLQNHECKYLKAGAACCHTLQALLEALEALLPQQLQAIPTDTVASGLWAMSRLQLQPSSEAIRAVGQYLLQQPQQLEDPQQETSSSAASAASIGSWPNDSSKSKSRLATCSSRTFGGLCYSLNFYMLREHGFWAAAAAAGLQHLQTLKPAGISNLLQGLAASGWADPETQPQTAAAAAAGLLTGSAQAADTIAAAVSTAPCYILESSSNMDSSGEDTAGAQGQQAAVAALLQAVEQLLLSQPQRLQQWRMRDISQMCQAYALMGYNCTLLFATVANHLLGLDPAGSSRTASQPVPRQQQQQWNVQHHGWNVDSALRHAKGQGPQRLADCRPGDAAGLAWAYVAAFCPNKVLLQELAAVIAARAGQLHAADCCRLLWAYATAGVVDGPMLAAVTAATAEEMHGVLPRTAAGSVWSLAQMRFEAPAFMEAALDRLAVCLEATAAEQHSSSSGSAGSGEQAGAVAAGLAASFHSGSGSRLNTSTGAQAGRAGAAELAYKPSVLQQLLSSSSPALLSGGPEATSTPSGELSMLSMMHRWQRSSRQQRQQQLTQDSTEQQQQAGQQEKEKEGVLKTQLQQQYSSIQADQGRSVQQLQQQEQQDWRGQAYVAGDIVQCSHRDVAQAVYACGRLRHYNGSLFRVLRGKFKSMLPWFSDSQLVEVLWGFAQLHLYDAANMEAAAAEVSTGLPALHTAVVAGGGPVTARLYFARTCLLDVNLCWQLVVPQLCSRLSNLNMRSFNDAFFKPDTLPTARL